MQGNYLFPNDVISRKFVLAVPLNRSTQATAFVNRRPADQSISTNLEQIIIYYQLPPDDSKNWSTNRCHCSLGNFKQSAWMTHWPGYWHNSNGITYNRRLLNLLWIYIALSTPMVYTFCYGQVRRISRQLLESS